MIVVMGSLCVLLAPRVTSSQGALNFTRPRLVYADAELISTEPSGSHVKELIPAKYKQRYVKWKNEYLSTLSGWSQWQRFALNSDVALTITISTKEAEGARVNAFQWDENGKLLAATIVLGNKLDSGYPSSVNYPITCSLAPGNLPSEVKGKILAATKLAHEFGHLNQIMNMDGRLYKLQNQLMLEYNAIFNANGRNTQDPRLLELADRMHGTPVSIAQDRESWAEIGAILFLEEKLREEYKLKMPRSIRDAINGYWLTYPEREWGEANAPTSNRR
jgi:hypothetical protein